MFERVSVVMAVLMVSCAIFAGGAAADTAQQAGDGGEIYSSEGSLVDTDKHTPGPVGGSGGGGGGSPSCEDQGPLQC